MFTLFREAWQLLLRPLKRLSSTKRSPATETVSSGSVNRHPTANEVATHGRPCFLLWALRDVWILRKIETVELLDRRTVRRTYSYDIDLDIVRRLLPEEHFRHTLKLPFETFIRQNFLAVDINSPWRRQVTFGTWDDSVRMMELISLGYIIDEGMEVDDIPPESIEKIYNAISSPLELPLELRSLAENPPDNASDYGPTDIGKSLSFLSSLPKDVCKNYLSFLLNSMGNYVSVVNVPNNLKCHKVNIKIRLTDGSGDVSVRRGWISVLGGPFVALWTVPLGPYGKYTVGHSKVILPPRTNVLNAFILHNGQRMDKVNNSTIDIAANQCRVTQPLVLGDGTESERASASAETDSRSVQTEEEPDIWMLGIYASTSRSYFAIPAFFIILFSWLLALLFLKSNQRIDGALSVTVCAPPIAAVFLLLLEEHEVVSIALTGPRLLLVSSLFLTVSAGLFNSPGKETNQFSFAHTFMVANYYIHTLLVCYFLSSLFVPELYKRINRSTRYLKGCSLFSFVLLTSVGFSVAIYLH